MNSINIQALIARKKRPLFMAHLIAGFPTFSASAKVARTLVRGGADILEIQIPFSDPMADGPSIATACIEALQRGASVRKSLALTKKLADTGVPIVIMSYINPVFRYGIAKFVRGAARSGVSGLIIPDAPFDSSEGTQLLNETRKHGVSLIPVITPGVPKTRLKELAKSASGFVYCTSRQGITGANSTFASTLHDYTRLAKQEFSIPFGLGFGVRTRRDFQTAAELADIVIAGSIFVDAIRSSRDPSTGVSKKIRQLLNKAD